MPTCYVIAEDIPLQGRLSLVDNLKAVEPIPCARIIPRHAASAVGVPDADL